MHPAVVDLGTELAVAARGTVDAVCVLSEADAVKSLSDTEAMTVNGALAFSGVCTAENCVFALIAMAMPTSSAIPVCVFADAARDLGMLRWAVAES